MARVAGRRLVDPTAGNMEAVDGLSRVPRERRVYIGFFAIPDRSRADFGFHTTRPSGPIPGHIPHTVFAGTRLFHS